MPKTVESVVKSLKLRAEPKAKALTVRVGTKKHVLPFEVRMLASADYLFVHVPPSATLMKVSGGTAAPVANLADAQAAVASFRKSSRKRTRKPSKVDMPQALETALKTIPSGFKLTYGPDGKPKLVKTRKRTSKSALKPAMKAAAKPAAKKEAKPAAKRTAKRKAKPMAKAAPKRAAKPAAKPAVKAAAKPAAKPARKVRAKRATKTAARAANPAMKRTAKPAVKAAAKPAKRRTRRTAAKKAKA